MNQNKKTLKFLNEKQIRCIELLCEENREITKVADEIGVSRTTIYAWMKDERFKAALEECEQDIKTRTHHIFVQRLPSAVNKLWKLTDCTDNRTKLQATKEWIERAIGKTSMELAVTDTRNSNDGLTLDEIVANAEKMLNETPADE